MNKKVTCESPQGDPGEDWLTTGPQTGQVHVMLVRDGGRGPRQVMTLTLCQDLLKSVDQRED